jgi:hypothetical protein
MGALLPRHVAAAPDDSETASVTRRRAGSQISFEQRLREWSTL